jgi:hypothetical protein
LRAFLIRVQQKMIAGWGDIINAAVRQH